MMRFEAVVLADDFLEGSIHQVGAAHGELANGDEEVPTETTE